MKGNLPKLPKGMGSYEQRGDKIRYRKKLSFYGVECVASVTGESIAEVNRLMKVREREFEERCRLHGTLNINLPLEVGMKKWLELYKKEELNEKSYDRIESTFYNHVVGTPLGGTYEDSITSDLIQRHMKHLNNSNGGSLSYSSTKKVYELLNQYFKYKYRREPYLNPMIGVSKPKNLDKKANEEMVVWDDEEMVSLTRVAFQDYIPGKSGYKHGLVIAFVMWSFLRIGEALALQWKDIDLENGIVNISKQLSRVRDRDHVGAYKTIVTNAKYNSSRKIQLNQAALDCIREYKNRCKVKLLDTYVIDNGDGRPVAMNTITNTYKAMIKAAGLPSNKHVTLHGLRHSGISYMLRHGMPIEVVSKMAGHKSIQITLDTYYSVLEKQKEDAMIEFNKNNKFDFK